jgi:hypothetical protein
MTIVAEDDPYIGQEHKFSQGLCDQEKEVFSCFCPWLLKT